MRFSCLQRDSISLAESFIDYKILKDSMQVSTIILNAAIEQINYCQPPEEDEFDIENFDQKHIESSEKISAKNSIVENA